MVLHEMADALRGQVASGDGGRMAQAMLAPEACYATPCDVLLDHRLNWQQKVELLRSWKADLEMRSMARGEGMVGLPDEDLGRAISAANTVLMRLQASTFADRGLPWNAMPAHGWAVSGH